LRGKDKGNDNDDAKEIKKELQEIKDYLKKHNENVNKVLTGLLSFMKQGGIINITLSNDKLVVELSGGKTKTIEENNLTSEQKTLKNYLQNSSGQKSLNRSELEAMIGRNYNEEKNNKKGDNTAIFGAILLVGIILAVIIGVVVYNNKKKRDY
jgi:hypothetical protein